MHVIHKPTPQANSHTAYGGKAAVCDVRCRRGHLQFLATRDCAGGAVRCSGAACMSAREAEAGFRFRHANAAHSAVTLRHHTRTLALAAST